MPNTLGTAKNHSGLKLSSRAKQRLNSERCHGRKEILLLTEQHEHPQLLPLLSSYHRNRRLTQFPLNLIRSTLIQPDSPLGVGLDAARLLPAKAAQHRSPHTPRCRVGPGAVLPTDVLGTASPRPSLTWMYLLHPCASTVLGWRFPEDKRSLPTLGSSSSLQESTAQYFVLLAAPQSSPGPRLRHAVPPGGWCSSVYTIKTLCKHATEFSFKILLQGKEDYISRLRPRGLGP